MPLLVNRHITKYDALEGSVIPHFFRNSLENVLALLGSVDILQ